MNVMSNFFRAKPKPSLLPPPAAPIVEELDRELERDTKFVGDVFRQLSKGIAVDEIAAGAGHKSNKNIVSFEYAIRGLRGDTPAKNIKYKSRDQMIFTAERLIASTSSAGLKAYLQGKLNEIGHRGDNSHGSAVQASPTPATQSPVAQQSSAPSVVAAVPEPSATLAESPESRPGVYVYSYPQYLSMESISPDGRAFYKIGASGQVANRVERQKRQTEVPEDLVLVRVFYDENPFELEAKFHSILRAANMHQKTTQGGVEWFSCNLATIDAIAKALLVRGSI